MELASLWGAAAWCATYCVALPAVLLASALATVALALRCRPRRKGQMTLGFFHPYAAAAGGGERVLWVALAALAASPLAPHLRVVVYTGDAQEGSAMLAKAKERFAVDLTDSPLRLAFVRLTCRAAVEAATWPRFTMLGQSLGSMLLGTEALLRFTPDVWVDTTGFAFTYPVARWLGGARVATYTHYPTITTEMLGAVAGATAAHNNAPAIAASPLLTGVKLVYYRFFAALYAGVGSCADVVMVNSSWTAGHIDSLWGRPLSTGAPQRGALVVFPPCNTAELEGVPVHAATRRARRLLVSVGQFRPEKAHSLQLEALAALRARGPQWHDVQLHLIGGARGAQDEALVARLQAQAAALGLGDAVRFRVNAPFPALRAALGEAAVGLHTMWNEHFGIGVVEMMAAGMVTVAHASGGPAADIVVPPGPQGVGFLADTPAGYADAIAAVLGGEVDAEALAARARAHVGKFSDAAFQAGFMAALAPLLAAVTA